MTTREQEDNYLNALSYLKPKLSEFKASPMYENTKKNQPLVSRKYQQIFSLNSITRLTEEDFHSFLSFKKGNHHWTGLERKGRNATSDMETLRNALKILLDENILIENRFPKAIKIVNGMGKALASAILLVAYPEKYGVWNGVSEKALKSKELQIFPPERLNDGLKYKAVNGVLLRLNADLKIDLWTLDTFWWYLVKVKKALK